MNDKTLRDAATLLWDTWLSGRRIAAIPEACRPRSLDDGYAVQRSLADLSGERVVGWKVAASSVDGQRHIGVDGPLAGRLLERFVTQGNETTTTLSGCAMCLAEVEFAFVMGRDIVPRATPYSVDEVQAAVATLHPALEFPDSRFEQVTAAGGAQLAADVACAWRFSYGAAMPDTWRTRDLSHQEVELVADGKVVALGRGGNALGDPRIALAWLANELGRQAIVLRAGSVVTTGTCIVPAPVRPGQRLTARYGDLGELTVTCTA